MYRVEFGVGGGAAVCWKPIRGSTGNVPAPARIAVIGMGRLGGSELGYGSDADVMFVCDPLPGADETHAVKWSVSAAEQLRTLLGTPSDDPPLEVDANLYPEGRSGSWSGRWPPTRPTTGRAQPWEVQALLRATPVAGDPDLGREFLAMADRIRYPAGGLPPAAVQEIRRIKSPRRRRAAAPRCGPEHPYQAGAGAGWPMWSGLSSCCSCCTPMMFRR